MKCKVLQPSQACVIVPSPVLPSSPLPPFPPKEAAPQDVIEIDLSSFLRAFGIRAPSQAELPVAFRGVSTLGERRFGPQCLSAEWRF